MARWTQQRRYPEDWWPSSSTAQASPSTTRIDVTECAIVKFMYAQHADEFTPYLCHPRLRHGEKSAGTRLTRTKTLAWGCDRCDFRMTANGTTTATWPPDFPERTCGQLSTTQESSTTA